MGMMAIAFGVQAQTVEIKGIRLGLPLTEIKRLYPAIRMGAHDEAGLIEKITIASAESKGGAMVQFRERDSAKSKVVDGLIFPFTPSSFDLVLDAVRTKYPKLQCENSKVTNRMGVEFTQTSCRLRDLESSLELQRYSGDLGTSLLLIVSDRQVKKDAEGRARQKKDI